MERGCTPRIHGLPLFLSTSYYLRMGKATNFKFCTHIYRICRNKNPLKISGKIAVGVLRDSRIFLRIGLPIYRAHRAVIFAVAQLSCVGW